MCTSAGTEEIMHSFKKTGLTLYEKLQSQGIHCLYIWGQKMTTFKKNKKVTKNTTRIIWQEFRGRHRRICCGKSHRSHNQNMVIK